MNYCVTPVLPGLLIVKDHRAELALLNINGGTKGVRDKQLPASLFKGGAESSTCGCFVPDCQSGRSPGATIRGAPQAAEESRQ
jgi:hypothetical protein